MAFDNRSRFVAWAKIVLPLVALGLLSTMFLFSRSIDPGDAIPFAGIDVESIAREQRIGGPRFAGTTSDGAALTVAAASARPDPAALKRFIVTDVTAMLALPVSGQFDLRADGAVVDTVAQIVDLSGGVVLTTSTGYRIETDHLSTGIEETSVVSDVEIRATGPIGTLTAGSMRLDKGEGGYVLVFKDGVNLIYDPGH